MMTKLTPDDFKFITSKPTGENHKSDALKKISAAVIQESNQLIDPVIQQINQARSGLGDQVVPHRFI